ncbi:hypothetical protein J6590_048591 [Homalodisca vitripennis]|nr:hypothetical protein J6590_048591 [Homalodisca vitripennis]
MSYRYFDVLLSFRFLKFQNRRVNAAVASPGTGQAADGLLTGPTPPIHHRPNVLHSPAPLMFCAYSTLPAFSTPATLHPVFLRPGSPSRRQTNPLIFPIRQ